MVDTLGYADEQGAKSNFTIDADHVMVSNGFFQEGGLMENIAQTAALHAGWLAQSQGKAVKNGFIGAIKDFEVFALPKTGEKLTTEIKIENQVFNVTVISGKVFSGDQLIATAEMKVFTDEQ